MFEKEENSKRCRSLTWWALLLVTILGLCVVWVPVSAAAQSSAQCPVYVEKLDNIHSLANQATNELGRAFAEKLAEMYGLADQSCQAHIKGNAYFEEGSPRADLKYQQALNLDKQILEKIGAVVPTFGVTAELKAKLEEAQRLYSQQVNFYAQSNQLSAQAGMAYRVGNRTVGDRLLDRANSTNDSANQQEDRAFALLEEAAELLCQPPEQREVETVPELGQVPAVIALAPPEGEYVGEGPIEECPECPREQGGPAETTDQGIQVSAPIFGVSRMLFDQVTDCETGEGIDPSLLQTEFVFKPGAHAPYDLSDLEKVVVKAEGYTPRDMINFSPMQVSLGFLQISLLVPAEPSICLTPIITEQPVYEVKPVCETTYEWLRKTPIVIKEPLDYFPKQATMPLGGIIAFHIKASDVDVLQQTCYGCVEGEAVKRIGPVADVVRNHWDLNSLAPYPAGELIGAYLGNCGDILYKLPEQLPQGTSLTELLMCYIDDLGGPLAKADDAPVHASAQITITGQRGNTCRVSVLLFQPSVSSDDDDVTEKAAEDCNPGQEVWEEESKLWLDAFAPKCMCAGQLYLLYANPSAIDVDNLTLRCDAATCESSDTTMRVSDPTDLTWSDNGAGGTFPFGNQGFAVAYQAPNTGKEMKITCSIDDSGTQYDDTKVDKDRKSIVVKILRVLPGDPTTHEIPSVLPAVDLPKQHFVTVRQTTRAQDKMRLEAQIQPNTDAAKQCITWDGADVDASNPLVGLVPRTSALRRPVQVKVGDRACKRLMAWVIWCNLKGDPKGVDEGYLKDGWPDYYYVIEGPIVWTATIDPKEIITDADRPNLEGRPDPAPLPAGTNSAGNLLSGGVDAKWDMSRQIRKRLFAGPPLQAVANPSPFENVPKYPTNEAAWIDIVGNDDSSTGDEDNNPYRKYTDTVPSKGALPTSSRLYLSHVIAQITSLDRPSRSLQLLWPLASNLAQRRWRLHFREFARVQLDGHWYRCSDWGYWRFHVSAINAEFVPLWSIWMEEDPPGHVLDLTNEGW